MFRTIILWICGLFACAMAGGMIVHYFYGETADVFGGLIGMATFACGRLWTTDKRRER
jgi:hypothetical protein